MQRNYEFALQVSSKPVWDAFVSKYPSGFYTELAKAHRDKLAAEAVRIEEQGEGCTGRTDSACYGRRESRRAG